MERRFSFRFLDLYANDLSVFFLFLHKLFNSFYCVSEQVLIIIIIIIVNNYYYHYYCNNMLCKLNIY